MRIFLYGVIGLLVISFVLVFSYQPAQAMPYYIMNLLLSMMHDVKITNPVNGEVLTYDTGFWVNKNVNGSSGESTQCINLSSSVAIIKNSTDGNCYVKYLVSGTNISITNSTDSITISATGSESTSCVNVGSQTLIIKNSTLGNCYVKSLSGGKGIALSNGTDTITISTNFVNGTGISITGTGAQTITNTGVTALTASSPLSASASTGSVTLSCPTCVTTPNAYVQLCSVNANASSTAITCNLSSTKHYLRIHSYLKISASAGFGIQFNGDTGNNYNSRYQANFVTVTANNQIAQGRLNNAIGTPAISVLAEVSNNPTSIQKTGSCNVEQVVTASNTQPDTYDCYFAWVSTNNITSVTITRWTGTGTLDTTSNLVVYGYD